MKAVLALFVTFMYLESQALALSGGPVYPVSTNIVGEYAGVLLPTSDVVTGGNVVSGTTVISTGTAGGTVVGSNAIGLFDLEVPDTGLAIGDFILFTQGRVFTGSIDAYADPDAATIQGAVQATYVYSINELVSGTLTTYSITATANGDISATVSADPNANSEFGSSSSSSGATQPAYIIAGTANMEISGGEVYDDGTPVVTEVIEMTVTGVQQSSTPALSTTFTTSSSSSGG